MSISDRLDEIAARCDAATDGPWRAALLDGVDHEDGSSGYRGGIYPGTEPGRVSVLITPNVDRRDAAFIAHARTDVPELVEAVRRRDAALRAVLDLHVQQPVRAGVEVSYCAECGQMTPCATRRAAADALGEEARDGQ